LPEPSGNISGSCVIGVYVFFKINFCKDSNEKGDNLMKTRMKKLISISTIPVLALALLLVLGTVLAEDGSQKTAPSLRCTIDYWWVRDNDPAPFPGHWEATISGDIEGHAVYPGGGGMRFAGQTSHYAGAFEIYDIDPADPAAVLLMAGDGEGSTTVRHGKNSNWRTSGTVTYAGPGFEDWIDRPVHQEGTFTWADDGAPEAGSGTFRVN
jgi:hypothetical protein